MNVEIIGSGDTPTTHETAFCNEQTLSFIEQKLLTLLAQTDNSHENKQKWEKELEKIRSLTPEAVTKKIGVVSRQYYWERTSYELAFIATMNALDSALENDPNFSFDKVALIVFGSSTPDHSYPGGDAYIQEKVNFGPVEGMSLIGACCSGTEAKVCAYRAMMLNPEDYPYALIVTGETVGSRSNAFESEDATIWGDGGGAFVLRANPKGDPNFGILGEHGRVDGTNGKYSMTLSEGQGAAPIHRNLRLDNSMCGKGREIFRAVVGEVADDHRQWIESHGFVIDDSHWLVPHNGNLHMIMSHGERLGFDKERILHRIPDRANQSSAATLATFAELQREGRLIPGHTYWFDTFGGGLKWWLVPYRVPA